MSWPDSTITAPVSVYHRVSYAERYSRSRRKGRKDLARSLPYSDTAFHATAGDPTNLTRCQRGAWQDRMLVETVLSMLTLVTHFKKVMHRVWASFQARLAFTMAAFNVLVQWHGFRPTAS